MDPTLQGPGFGGFGAVIGLAVVGFAVVIGFAVVAGKRNKERVAALQEWARRREWRYQADDEALLRLLPRQLLGRGTAARAQNVLRGRLGGLPVTAFDHSYVTRDSAAGAGGAQAANTSTTHRYQVLLVQAPREWPFVSAETRGLFGAIAVALGGQDVLVGVTDFDQLFRVKADDEQAARQVLVPLAPALLARPEQMLELDGTFLRLARRGELRAAELEAWLAELDGPVARALQPEGDGTGTDRDGRVQDG